MARKPMKANETRHLKMFMPTLNKICDIELRALGVEHTIMGDGSRRPLLHVEQTTKVDDKPKPDFDIRLWVDSDGQVLKQEQDLLGGYVQYRTTEEAAKSPAGPIQFDLIKGTAIKVARKIPNPERNTTRQVSHRARQRRPRPDDPQRFTADCSTRSQSPDRRSWKSRARARRTASPVPPRSTRNI